MLVFRFETPDGQPIPNIRCTVDSFGWGVPRGQGQATIAEGQTDTQGRVAFESSAWPAATYQVSFALAGVFGHGVMLDIDGSAQTIVFAYDNATNTLTQETTNGVALPPPPAADNGDGGRAGQVQTPAPAQLTAYAPTYQAYLTQGVPARSPLPTLDATPAFTPDAPQAALATIPTTPNRSVAPAPTPPAMPAAPVTPRTDVPLFLAIVVLVACAIGATRRGRRVVERAGRAAWRRCHDRTCPAQPSRASPTTAACPARSRPIG